MWKPVPYRIKRDGFEPFPAIVSNGKAIVFYYIDEEQYIQVANLTLPRTTIVKHACTGDDGTYGPCHGAENKDLM